MKTYQKILGLVAGAMLSLPLSGCFKFSLNNTNIPPPNPKSETWELENTIEDGKTVTVHHTDDRDYFPIQSSDGKTVDALRGLASLVWDNSMMIETYEVDGHLYEYRSAVLPAGELHSPATDDMPEMTVQMTGYITVAWPLDEKGNLLEDKNKPPVMVSTYVGNLWGMEIPIEQLIDIGMDGMSADDNDIYMDLIYNEGYYMSDLTEDEQSFVHAEYATLTTRLFQSAEYAYSELEK